MALPAFAAAAPGVQQLIDISCPPGPQQQTRLTLLRRANGSDRPWRTDTLALYRPCCAYYADSVRTSLSFGRVVKIEKARCRPGMWRQQAEMYAAAAVTEGKGRGENIDSPVTRDQSADIWSTLRCHAAVVSRPICAFRPINNYRAR